MLITFPSPFTPVLANCVGFFSLLLNFFNWIPSIIQNPAGNEVHEAEQTTWRKLCISAHKEGLLPPYVRGIMTPIDIGQNNSHTFSLMYDTT